MKKTAVLQSNYIPWKGYFDIIHDVDEFIFYDEVQYTSRDWRNRNKIIASKKIIWLSVPVGAKVHRRITEVRLEQNLWQEKHYRTIEMAYHKMPFFHQYKEFLQYVYLERKWAYLYELNRFLIEHISHDFLHIQTIFSDSRKYPTLGTKHEKLLHLVQSAHTDIYVSGPAAKDYIVEEDYRKAGIQLIWKDYEGYPQYPQDSAEFTHFVSIWDLLFHVGDEAPYYIWGWRK